ncbi:MAG: glycosyltransferase family 4 protein [Thermoleophilaceae bacterium]|nr:glycosyltransferase family 4 protein [Thermoleophilaceae bacterium]
MSERVVLACDWFLRYCAGLAGGLHEEGAEVTLLSRAHAEEFGGDEAARRDYVERHAHGARRIELPGRVRDAGALVPMARIARSLRDWRPDFVHLQDSVPNDWRLVWAAGARPRRYALTVHDPVTHPGTRRRPLKEQVQRLLVLGAGVVFVHAESARDQLLDVWAPRAPVVVVPHGVEEVEQRPLPERPTVLFFGILHPHKGLDVLLEAMPAVWERVPQARLVVAGAGPLPDHPVLEDARVTVERGHVPDAELPRLFGDATCVALPYRAASQSGVGSLARRFARPIVATRVGGLPELVTPGGGRLVAPEDPTALAAALAEVLGDPRLAGEMSAKTARAAGEASWRNVARLTLSAYREHLRR